jgi:hypothetical protein
MDQSNSHDVCRVYDEEHGYYASTVGCYSSKIYTVQFCNGAILPQRYRFYIYTKSTTNPHIDGHSFRSKQ